MKRHSFYIYSNVDFSEPSAGTTRMLYYAKALADDTHHVYLVSCCSNSFTDENFKELEPNIFVLEKKKPTTNFFRTFSFVRKLFTYSKRKEGDKTFIYYPFPLVFLELMALFYLKGIRRQAVYSELNEIPKHTSSFHAPMSIKNPKYSFKKILFKTVFTIMEPVLFFYDGIICISTAMEKYGSQFNKNTLRIPILTDPDASVEKSDNIFFTQDAFNIGFSGSIHGTKEDLDNFMSVISKIKKQGHHISFNLCGHIFSRYESEFLKKCNSRSELNYYGNLNKNDLAAFLSQQDLLVVPRGYSVQNKYGFSTKLSDYLNHQKMVLVTDISDNKLYIKDGTNGFIVPPNNPELMYEKLIYIITNYPELSKRIVPNAIETSKNEFYYLNYRKVLRSFLIPKLDDAE